MLPLGIPGIQVDRDTEALCILARHLLNAIRVH